MEAKTRAQQAEIDQLKATLRRERAEHAAEIAAKDAEITRLREELAQERQAHRATKASLRDLLQAVERLDERFRALLRRQYGASSERVRVDEPCIPEIAAEIEAMDRAREAAEAARSVAEATDGMQGGTKEADAAGATVPAGGDGDRRDRKGRRRPANAGGRKPLPADLPREEVTYEPPADHPLLAMAVSRKQIGTTTIERLDITPVRVVVQVMQCPVYSLRLPGGGRTQQTMAPPGVIERGQVSDRFLVTSVLDKVQDHLPAHRQEQRFARAGAAIRRSKITRWHMDLADFLAPVAEAVLDEIRQSPAVGIDDTVHRLVVADRHVCKQGRLIAVSAPTGIFYQFQATREAKWFTRLLEGFTGALMGDAYSGHGQLLAQDGVLALFCWAHARRKFFESDDRRRRTIILDLIARLYAVEDAIAGHPPDARVAERKRRAAPVLAQIHELLTSWKADRAVLPKSGIGMATDYVLTRWDGFTAYLDQGHAPIDNNATERGMRPNALHRKNSLFSASRRGAESYATLLTLTQSAWLHDLDPHAYLLDVIDQMHHASRPVENLTPIAYANRRKCRVGKPS